MHVSVDARGSLDSFLERSASGTPIYITNANGDYLVHPDRNKVFGFEFGQPQRWDTDFQIAETEGSAMNKVFKRWRGPEGPVLSTREVLAALTAVVAVWIWFKVPDVPKPAAAPSFGTQWQGVRRVKFFVEGVEL